MFAATHTYVIQGITARHVTIEANIRSGLPSFSVIGIDPHMARELRERVRAAILNAGFDFPQRSITVNLVATDVSTHSCAIDLAVATAVLCASGQLDPEPFANAALVGELGLDGGVRTVRGVLAIVEAAGADEIDTLVVPRGNAHEATLGNHGAVAAISLLSELVDVAKGDIPPIAPLPAPAEALAGADLADLRGHASSLRAMEIAAAGGHHLLFVGAPGCGKTMLARRMPSILPPMTAEEALEVTRIQSAAGSLRIDSLASGRPFRAPHHTINATGLAGGGTMPYPGEVTLATNGVLFLDELADFSTRTLDSLRAPLTDGTVSVTRGVVFRLPMPV